MATISKGNLPDIFDINNILTTIFGYPLSYVESIGTATGLLSVWFAAKQNILTWPTGLINICCFFAIFWQVHLYSDVFLQIYFFATSIYGWLVWKKVVGTQKPVSTLSTKSKVLTIAIVVFTTAIFGLLIKNIHLIFPEIFTHPAAFPFADTFIAACSIIATIFLAKRILENWILWIVLDLVCVVVYTKKDILFIAAEYAIFFVLASYGLYLWTKSTANDGIDIG